MTVKAQRIVHSFLAIIVFLILPKIAIAHGTHDVFWRLDVEQQKDGSLNYTFDGKGVELEFPSDCKQTKVTPQKGVVICSKIVEGQTVSINGLNDVTADVLARVVSRDGVVTAKILSGVNDKIIISKSKKQSSLFLFNSNMIVSSLEFLAALVLLALLINTKKNLLLVTLGFAGAATISFLAKISGQIMLPTQTIPVIIALSLLYLLIEHSRKIGTQKTEVFSSPLLTAIIIGIVHGINLATNVGSVNLTLPTMLFHYSFMLICCAITLVITLRLIKLVKQITPNYFTKITTLLLYTTGSLATYQLLSRLNNIF